MINQTISLADIVRLSHRAGEAIMVVYAEDKIVAEYKADQSPVTRADLAAHHIILKYLSEATPDIPVLSEESEETPYEVRRTWTRFWLVDPLDGTKEFIKKNNEFTVNIALIHAGKPILGVVYAPALGVTYAAELGAPAWKASAEGTRSIFAKADPTPPFRVVASRSHGASEEMERFLSRLGPVERVSCGSSLKLCRVAEGAADFYPRFGPTMEWDTAAAQSVVEAAGGSVTDLTGVALRCNKQNMLNPHFMVAGSPSFPWRQSLYPPAS
jgi:3'(2'), 5'-bisphosphate nucleotidase